MSEAVAPSAALRDLGMRAQVHISKGDKAFGKAEDYYRTAGVHLLDAREHIKRTKEMTWADFLSAYKISETRARDYIAIANGTKTLDEIRAVAREGMRALRDRRKREAEAAQEPLNVKREPERDTQEPAPLAIEKKPQEARS